MIISFGHTIKGIITKKKKCTRRAWKDNYAAKFCQAFEQGKTIHQAWSKSPLYGGEFLGEIKLTCKPYQEYLKDIPESDIELEAVEGIETKEQFLAMPLFKGIDKVWVIRFDVISVVKNNENSNL